MASLFDVFTLAGLRKTLDQWEFFSSQPSTNCDEMSPNASDQQKNTEGSPEKSISEHEITTTPNKSSLKRVNKKPKKSTDADTDVSETSPFERNGKTSSVQWGTVEEVLFARTVSVSSVPTDGAYPLGLGAELEKVSYSIDAKHQDTPTGRDSAASDNWPKKPTGRRSRSNSVVSAVHPFKISSEQHRILTLQENYQNWSVINDTEKNGLASSVLDLNKEVKSISESRTTQSGCSCKSIKVDSGCSKTKLIAEIKNGNIHLGAETEPEEELQKLTKAQLTTKAKNIVSQCQLCVTDSCECVMNGVPCSQETCGCLQHGYHPERHAQSCASPLGRILYDREKVRTYRQDILSALDLCPPVNSSVDDLASSVASRDRANSLGSIDSESSASSRSTNNTISSVSSSPVAKKRKKKSKAKTNGSVSSGSGTMELGGANSTTSKDIPTIPSAESAVPPASRSLPTPFPPVSPADPETFTTKSVPTAPPPVAAASSKSKNKGKGKSKAKEWSCPSCTFINPPFRGACELCGDIKKH